MPRMVTTATHQYYGRRLHAGDEYDCEDHLVELMGKMGWARPLEQRNEEHQQQHQQYQTRVLTASPRATGRRKK